jgi:ankyrin repeat protein
MAAESQPDRSRFVEPLPSRPNLEKQQNLAKDLLRAAWRGDSAALERIRALHPRPPAPDAMLLADAQLVIARGYGFESWAAMKRKIESLTRTPVEQFVVALHAQDVDRVRELLEQHAEVRAAINRPISHFDSPPVMRAAKNLPLLDLLIEYGADINQKTSWWAGPFGILEYDITPEEAAPLVARGAAVDIFAAAHLGMFDRVRELLDADPSLVHARGGDGKTALHCARTPEIAQELIGRGAGIDVRCVDHESTPLQYHVRQSPAIARLLLERGARCEIFAAVALGDPALVDACLREDPHALEHRIGHGVYTVAHNGKRASTAAEIGIRRGDIYRWVLGHSLSVTDVAAKFGFPEVFAQLVGRGTPVQQLLSACSAGDRDRADRLVAEHPGLVASLNDNQQRLLVERVQAGDLKAVDLMLTLGFDTSVTGQDTGDALHWAAFLGDRAMVERVLAAGPALNVRDATHGGPALGWAIAGSTIGWRVETGEFAAVVQLLLDAGERVDASALPTGRDDVDQVLRRHLKFGII